MKKFYETVPIETVFIHIDGHEYAPSACHFDGQNLKITSDRLNPVVRRVSRFHNGLAYLYLACIGDSLTILELPAGVVEVQV